MNVSLEKWIRKYGSHDMVSISDPELCLNELRAALNGRRVYLYGAGAVGKTFFRLFSEIGVRIEAAFDKDYENRRIDGLSVFSPDQIRKVIGEDGILITAANWRNQEQIREYLKERTVGNEIFDGSLMHAPLQRAICVEKNKNKLPIRYEMCPSCFMERNYCDLLRENLLQCKSGIKRNLGKSRLPLIGVILGNNCSLRCEHCVEAIPFQKRERKFEPKSRVVDSIRKMANSIDFVTVVDFVGGEPFLHPDLPEIIEEVLTIPNIGLVNVFTNGTVLPSEKLIRALKHDFVVVNISDYSKQLDSRLVENIDKTEAVLLENKIPLIRVENMTWFDMSSFEKNNDTEEELTKRFHDCRINSCHRLFDGKLFRCLHMYAGYCTGQIPFNDSILRIDDCDEDELIRKLDEFWEEPYSPACRYCELPYISKLVPSGAQMKGKKE